MVTVDKKEFNIFLTKELDEMKKQIDVQFEHFETKRNATTEDIKFTTALTRSTIENITKKIIEYIDSK